MDEASSFGEKIVQSELTKAIVIGVVGIAAAFFARSAATTVWDKTFTSNTEDSTES